MSVCIVGLAARRAPSASDTRRIQALREKFTEQEIIDWSRKQIPRSVASRFIMSNDEIVSLTRLPVAELRRRARVPFRLVPDRAALLDEFARSIVDEIRTHNARDEPTRLILPVGPVAQYATAVAISNRERVSWRKVYSFNIDEFIVCQE